MNRRPPDERAPLRRRTFVRATSLAGVGLLAGCLGGDGYDESIYEGEPLVADEPDYGGALVDVDYPGTVDWTGERTVTVLVGTGDGTNFGPAAIRIDRGTTVVWEWTGDGGPHDVVDTGDAFRSSQTASADYAFEHVFEESGVHTYVCRPHRSQGMKGAVEVV